jgi:hypothetical protein
LNRFRAEYRDALKNEGRRRAFDRLVEAWSSELGAINYAESLTLNDLLLLTGAVDNRAFTESLRSRLDSVEVRLNALNAGSQASGA